MKTGTAMHRPRQHGLSLLIVLVLLAAMSLSAAALLRQAVGNEKVSNNTRLQAMALNYAEAALRYCEQRLALSEADALRPLSLQDAQLPLTSAQAPAWNLASSWTTPRAVTVLPKVELASADSPGPPARPPECLVEKQLLAGEPVYLLTARGFSPDYSADAVSGQSRSGAVVWLQSLVFLDRQAARALQDRTWRRLLNPPIR